MECPLNSLPELCWHQILKRLDADSRSKLFQASRGSQKRPGCATSILAASRVRCHLTADTTRPALACRMMHWAAQLTTGMELSIKCAENSLADVLVCCLQGGPLAEPHNHDCCYPGVTKLVMQRLKCHTFLPSVLATMFPNLQRLEFLGWQAEYPQQQQQYGSVQDGRGLSGLRHISATLGYASRTDSAVCRHVAEQLCNLPSLASLLVDDVVLQAAPAAVLNQLTRLEVWHQDVPLQHMQVALAHCTQLHTLAMSAVFRHHLVSSLPSLAQLLPQLSALELGLDLDDQLMHHLLAMHNLTHISLDGLGSNLHGDYTSCACKWRCLQFKYGCSDRISQLPLHTLDTPITARIFQLTPSDNHTTNLAFIQAAKPHLVRCGGVRTGRAAISIDITECPSLTQPQAEVLLQCWAPCVLQPDKVYLLGAKARVLLKACVAQVWPDAEL